MLVLPEESPWELCGFLVFFTSLLAGTSRYSGVYMHRMGNTCKMLFSLSMHCFLCGEMGCVPSLKLPRELAMPGWPHFIHLQGWHLHTPEKAFLLIGSGTK